MKTVPALPVLTHYFQQWESTNPDGVFLRQPEGTQWKEFTWKEVGDQARRIVSRITACGLQRGDRIAILSQNCAEWIICDLAILLGGFVSVPLYANVNADTMNSILTHSGSKLLFIGKLLPKDWENIRSSIPSSVRSVSMAGYEKPNIQPWEDFMKHPEPLLEFILPSPDDLLTIIYTSGTTGAPKGVMHSHLTVFRALEAARSWVGLDKTGNRFFSYLPLSHAAERGLVEFGCVYSGGSISFVESQETFTQNIRDAQPTHFFGVPRIWEKFQSGILDKFTQARLDFLLKIPGVNRIVRNKVKKALGLYQAGVILTGAAPVSLELLQWFDTLGIVIREAYGMSENFNVCAMNPPGQVRMGTAGKLFEGQDILIDPETGEIRQRCAWLMKGYYNDPKLTAHTLRNGFLHTGDMGKVTPDGYLTLAGRVKDIFKTSKGEYINPGTTEATFLALREIDQACVLGSTYPQPFIVVGLSNAGRQADRAELARGLQAVLDECNRNTMEYQRLRKIIIVKEEWTVANELLTPTLKMKRNALASRYETSLRSLYDSHAAVSWE